MNIEVKGHSGCQIDVVHEGQEIYVYKSTVDPKYLSRLKLQAEKQQVAANVSHQHIRVPKIIEINQTADKVVLKMQYVYSKNFIEFFEQAGFEQIDYLIWALKNFLDYEVECSTITKLPASVLQSKFVEIKSKVENNPLCGADKDLKDILNDAEYILNSVGVLTIPLGVCHGDLTFSNVLFNGNNYYLIDFLDSFIETPLQDIVKIRQDTCYYWSKLMYTKPYDPVRLRIVLDKIDKEIDQYFSAKYDWYVEHYQIMQLMNILRILPYTHEEKVLSYLKDILKGLLNEI